MREPDLRSRRRKLGLFAIPVAFAVGGGIAMVGPLGTDEEYEAALAMVERVGGPEGWPVTPRFEGVFAVADPGMLDVPGDPLRVRDGAFERRNSSDGTPTRVTGRYEVVFDVGESQQRCQELYDWLRGTGTNDMTLTVEDCLDNLRSPTAGDGLSIQSTSVGPVDAGHFLVASFVHTPPDSSQRVLAAMVTREVVRDDD